MTAGEAGLNVLREGWKPVRGETSGHVHAWPGGTTRSATARAPRSGDAPYGITDGQSPWLHKESSETPCRCARYSLAC